MWVESTATGGALHFTILFGILPRPFRPQAVNPKGNDALLILAATAVLPLLVSRAVPRLDASPRGRGDSRIEVITSIGGDLLGLTPHLDHIVDGSLGPKCSYQATHRLSGVRVFDPSFSAEHSFSLSPALVLVVGSRIGMHTLFDNLLFRQRSAVLAAVVVTRGATRPVQIISAPIPAAKLFGGERTFGDIAPPRFFIRERVIRIS